AAPGHARGVVVQFHATLDRIEERRRQGHVARPGVAVGDAAHVRVHAEDFLDHHDAATRCRHRIRAPGADAAGGRVEGDVAAHWMLLVLACEGDPDASILAPYNPRSL